MSVLEKMGLTMPDVEPVEVAPGELPEWMPKLEMALNIAESQMPHIFALAAA